MLFQSLLYCSNSCTSLHFKTLKSHTKQLKFAATCFGFLWNHLQGVHGCTLLGYWIGMLIYICYKECRVCGCMSIHSICMCVCVCGYLSLSDRRSLSLSLARTHARAHAHTHTHRWNELTYNHMPTNTLYNSKSTFQFSNLAKYSHGPPEDDFKGDQNM
jgi:hypothetical protein